MEQRFKATQQAYWFLLTLEANQALRTSSNVPPPPESREEAKGYAVTHAGGVVFRQRSGVAEYLLVQATKDAADWVLPKGHIEPGEDEKTCAIREVKEETGVWARIKNELKIVKYPFEGQTVIVQFYVMEAVEQGKPLDPSRKREWLQLQAALDRVRKYDEVKDLLRMAEQERTEA
jgi:ADP-ribose pyrophosphatase YjhB (NUDIX family)